MRNGTVHEEHRGDHGKDPEIRQICLIDNIRLGTLTVKGYANCICVPAAKTVLVIVRP
jgi:hypothetical protein